MYSAAPARKPNFLKKFIRTRLIERTLQKLPKSDKILDFGTGYGFYLSINPHAVGIDGDQACIDYLKERGFNVKQCNVLESLPFENEKFEYVVAHDVLEHFTYKELEVIFGEIHRILKQGGCFLVFVPNKRGYDLGLRTGAGHKLFVTIAEIKNLSKGHFSIKKNYSEPLPRSIGKFFDHNKEVFELIKS
jgi:SAM-dependent methyltransferase